MNANWKSFWAGVGAVLTIAAGILLYLLRIRGNGGGPGKDPIQTPAKIISDAKAQVERKRAEIKADSDAALAARFNASVKKEKKG
jgi:hypothetical protein